MPEEVLFETEAKMEAVVEACSEYDVPLYIEPGIEATVVHSKQLAGYLIPIVFNAGDISWVTGAHKEWVRLDGGIDWARTDTEAYIVCNPDSDRENDLLKAVFNSEKNEVTITTVLGVEACNEAFIKRSIYNSDSRTLTVTFGDKRREEVSSSSGCAGAVALDVYVAKIVLENDISAETVMIVSDGQETTINSISS